ncbi:MAG: hypothetical protein MI919_27445, partial [Holophagales bacterium]|nr:hypothetical protein [Holophagales bacterium]
MCRHLCLLFLGATLLLTSTAFAQTPPYNRTVIVQSTGVPTTDGAALLAAIAGVSPPPSSTNRWVIQLEGVI